MSATLTVPGATATIPLGVAAMLSDTFGLVFRRGLAVLLAVGLPVMLCLVLIERSLTEMLLDPDRYFDGIVPFFSTEIAIVQSVSTAGHSLVSGLLIGICGNILRMGKAAPAVAARRTFQAAPGLVAIGVVVLIATALGMVLLVVPGIWAMAALSVAAPCMLYEGWRAGPLSRSVALTRGYRWPIAGMMLVIFALAVLLAAANELAYGLSGLAGAATVLYIATEVALAWLMAVLFAAFTALLYQRLLEIKEGTAAGNVVEVFS